MNPLSARPPRRPRTSVTTTPFSAHPKTPATTMSAPPNTLIKQDNNDSYTPPGPSSLTSARGGLHHKSSKESIQSYQASNSNFSTHTDAPSAIYKDREDLSGQDRRPHTSRYHAPNQFRDRNCSVSGFSDSDTIQKSTFSLQNESQSNVSVTHGVEPDRRSPDVRDIHPVHSAPLSRSYNHSEISISTSVGTNGNVDETLAHRHPSIRCYHCQQEIVGARFRCVDCTTIDINICWNCEIAGFPGDLDASGGGHSSSHAMLKVTPCFP
ncbi:hypothetical protein BC826DRAFT_64782 [Russula brevipes]|nr:hypothetical protein BC826DRAFT_64782 [Russula brevipes]